MRILLFSNLITCVCAFGGFAYGIAGSLKSRKAMYFQMITFAVGCMAFGRLYQVVRLLTGGSVPDRFQLGVLGIIGSLAFLFSANFGLMDSLADDGSEDYSKYRLIPLIAPIVAVAVYAAFFLLRAGELPPLTVITAGVITAFIAGASYFNFKHLIFPDVDFGVINCLKIYNLLALLFEALCLAELIANSRGNEIAALVICSLMGVILLAIPPVVERGIKRWTT